MAADVPPFLRGRVLVQDLELVAQTVESLRRGDPAPALGPVGNGPQALAERYPALQEILFTSGPGTLGKAGHAMTVEHCPGRHGMLTGSLPDAMG